VGKTLNDLRGHLALKHEVKALNEPQISVIVPVYNVKPYLRQCLDSIIGQTYRNLEIIIVDDGSTDGCGDICDRYSAQDRRVTAYHTVNRGLSAARNHGLDHISENSEFVLFVDSDDWIEKDTVQKLYRAIDRYRADIAICRFFVERRGKRSVSSSLDRTVVLENKKILKFFITTPYISNVAWGKLYRRALFSSIRYPEGRAFEDVATTYKLLAAVGRVVVIPEILFHYRCRHNSISRTYSMNNLLDGWRSGQEKYAALAERVSDPESMQQLIRENLMSVSRMWRCYGGFTEAEKTLADSTVEEMRAFVAEHRSAVLKGRSYSALHKLTCLYVMSRSPVYMWGLNRLYRMYLLVDKRRRY